MIIPNVTPYLGMNEELELKNLTERVIAAGGRAGRKSGAFLFDYAESEGYKRGDEHREVEGLYFLSRYNKSDYSRWMNADHIADERRVISKNNGEWYDGNKAHVADRGKVYYRENRDKELDRQKRYREENKERESARQKRWREENAEKVAERQKRYRDENKDKLAVTSSKWYEENKERQSENGKRWRKENPDKVSAKNARRRAKIREALDPNANKSIVDSRYAAREYLSNVTGYVWHVDHTIPLDNGGKHHEDNLQVVPGKWNESKGNRHCNRWIEDSNIYRYATAVEKRFEREAIAAQGD